MEREPSSGSCSIIGFGNNSCITRKSGFSSIGNNNNNKTILPLSNPDPDFFFNQRLLLPFPFNNDNNNNVNNHENDTVSSNMKAKIMSHPLFPRLLTAYANCQKIGAPPEVAAGIDRECANCEAETAFARSGSCAEEDPGLNQFMEAYCEMLTKYEQELAKPLKEAMIFFAKTQSQLHALAAAADSVSQLNLNKGSGSQELIELNGNENGNENYVDPEADDKELKNQLLRKYSGYVGCLKQEFMKKKKNGKLPKEARQHLLDWWNKHYKWPYPSESEKVNLAETTGLDLKQINNWFINQRKRHWKPSEDMQFVIMDGNNISSNDHNNSIPNPNPRYYFDNVLCNHFPMDCSSSFTDHHHYT